jgi:hypothetical protein
VEVYSYTYRPVDDDPPAVTGTWARPVATGTWARPAATSAAVRIAAVRPVPPPAQSAEVEAVLAWLHAHETYERFRRVTAATAAVIVTAVLFTL